MTKVFEIKKITKISFLMILLILSIGAVSAAEHSADNMTADTDVDLMLDDSPARVSSTNVNDNYEIASSWEDIEDYLREHKTNIYLQDNGIFTANVGITITNNINIIGGENSYITTNSNIIIPFRSTNSNLVINFINVTFKDSVCNMMLQLRGTTSFTNCVFDNITTGTSRCSVVYNDYGTMTFDNCNFTNCVSEYGVITNYNLMVNNVKLNVNNCNFIDNLGRHEPGAINNCGLMNVTDSTFIRNNSTNWAGAIHTHSNARSTIKNSKFIENDALWNGGALYSYSTLEVYNCTFISNVCHTNNGGGAIGGYSFGSQYNITVINSTFLYNENKANSGQGGAIGVLNNGYLTVLNSKFYNNTADIGMDICAFTATVENGTEGSPSVIIKNNQFGANGTIYITGNNYVIENCSYDYVPTNLNSNSAPINDDNDNVNDIMPISYDDENRNLLAVNLLADNGQTVLYIKPDNPKKDATEDGITYDGTSWETAFGYTRVSNRGVKSIRLSDQNSIIYMAPGNYSYLSYFDVAAGSSIIGTGNQTFLYYFPLSIYAVKNVPEHSYTFVNITFVDLNDTSFMEMNKYIAIMNDAKFINCTFINCYIATEQERTYGGSGYISDFMHNDNYQQMHPDQSLLSDWHTAYPSFVNCTFKDYTYSNDGSTLDMYPYSNNISALIRISPLYNVEIINCTFENIAADYLVAYDGSVLEGHEGKDGVTIVNPDVVDCNVKGIAKYAQNVGLDADDDYYGDIITINYTPTITIEVEDSFAGEVNPVVITLPADATGNVTVTINGKTYKGKVSNGAATINADPLDYGNYAAHVDYSGDDKYTPATKVANFAVGFNNYLTNDTFFSYFNQDGTLKEEYGYNNLTFNGIFSNLGVETVTINKPITIYGKETVLNNIGLVIDSDNVLVKNFTFNINDLESAIEIISKNNVTLVNNTINFNATADKDGYGIYASSVENMTVANNTINYIGATEENGPVNAIIFIENGKNISMTGNNISATLDSVPVSYEPLPPWTATIFSQGVYMSGTDINVENNDLKVKTGESSGAYDTIYGFILNADNASFANNNITAEGNSYIYGLTISGKNSNVTQNNINVTTPGKYAGGIQINSPYAGTVSENNVTVKSKDVAYGIFTYGDVNATIKENNVDIASSTLYAIEVIGNNETVIENNITAKGNYTIGIASSTNGPVTIKDNQIKVDGEGLGEPTTGDLIKPTNAGILVTNYPTSATITGNTIIANIPAKPMGNLTAGMKLASSNTLVENNTITVTPTAGSGYDSIYGLSSTGNDVTIKNNTITVEGDKAPYEYGVSVSGDDVNIDSNKITVNNDKNYADGIQVNTGFSGTVANNEVNVKGNQSAYGIISSAWGSTTVEATYDNNNVTVDGQTAYGLQLLGTEENATNNNVVVTGEYTMGITTNTPIIEIKDNNVTAEGTGKTSLPTYDMFGATNQGILIYNNATKATITGNNVTTTGEYAVNVLKTENSVSTVKDNYLVAEKLTGNDAINNITGEIENNTPIKDILVSQDLVKYYKNGTQYTVTVLNNKVPVANKKVTVVLNGPSFKNLQYTIVTNSEGVATLPINLAPGQYTINAFTDNSEEIENTITVLPQSYSLEAEDIDMFVKDGTKYEVTLTDASGSPVANTKVTLTLNGKSFKNLKYDRITDANGVASLPINLAVGQYAITATYGSESITTNVNVLPKESALIAENVVKYYKNGTQYNVKLLDENGKPAAGKTITVTLNGASFKNLKYNIVTNNDGVATLNIGLAPGAYTITANYGEMSTTNTINVLPTLTTEDLTKAVNKPASFTAKLVDQQGKPMANAKVSFTITGKTIKTVTYTKVTDANGIASLPINLAQGDYTITVSDNSGAKAAGNVKVTKATA